MALEFVGAGITVNDGLHFGTRLNLDVNRNTAWQVFSCGSGNVLSKAGNFGQTIVMVTHSTKAASRAKRVLFIKDGEVFHQIYKANMSDEEMYAKISAALTVLATGGEQGE